MQYIKSIIENLDMRMPSMDLTDVIEIIIVSFLIYHILKWIKNTRAWALLKGLLVICAFLLIAAYFRMNTILWMASNVLTFAVTALIVVMQPELRKALEELGNKSILSTVLPLDMNKKDQALFSDRTLQEIVKACVEMGKARTGALIVVQQKQPLHDFEHTGIRVDGLVSSQLLINIFEHNTPLHDGAVIVEGDRVTSATCYLPLSDNMNLGKELGTRHRAGIGVSEMTDALTIIVSEETGTISVAYKGTLERGLNAEKLKERLRMIQNKGVDEGKKIKIWGGKGKNERETET